MAKCSFNNTTSKILDSLTFLWIQVVQENTYNGNGSDDKHEIETHKELKCKSLASGQRWNSNTTEHEGMEDSLYSRKKHRWSLILVPQYRLGSDLELQRQSWLMGSNELLRCVRLIELWSSLLVLNMLLVLLDSVWYIGKRWTGLDNFFVKLFRYLWTVQKSVFVLWEIFVPLKKIGQAC